MKIIASVAFLFVIGIGVALGAVYASKSSTTTASKVCACANCCPDGSCCCESGVCACETCACDCCADGEKACAAKCCADKSAGAVAVAPSECTKGCCKKK